MVSSPSGSIGSLAPGLRPNGPIVFVGTGPHSGLGVDNRDLFAVDPDGTNVRDLTDTLGAEQDPAWSPDGSRAAFVRTSSSGDSDGRVRIRAGVFVSDPNGLYPDRVLACAQVPCEVRDLAWSPDGVRLAFVVDSRRGPHGGLPVSTVEVMNADGTGRITICSFPRCWQGLTRPLWSPDGRDLAFSNEQMANFPGLGGPPPSSIYVAASDGTTVRRLTNAACDRHTGARCTFDAFPAWSPDGTRITFSRSPAYARNGPTVALDVMNADGSGVRTLSACDDPESGCTVADAAWSPDGGAVAFATSYDRPVIAVVDPMTGRTRTIRTCRDGTCLDPSGVRWSPDGRELLFVAGEPVIYTIGADGTAMTRIIGGVYGCCATWLPAGAGGFAGGGVRPNTGPVLEPPAPLPGLIAFVSSHAIFGGKERGEIYTIRPDGAGLALITRTRSGNGSPAWSPDGSRIAFASHRGPPGEEIYVMNADGSDQTRLTSFPGAAQDPAWSPDGSRIAFVGWPNGIRPEIYVMDADGTGVRQLTTGDSYVAGPTWSPDGSSILFERSELTSSTGETGLGTVDVATGAVRTIVPLPGSESDPAWSPDGTRIAFVWWTQAGSGLYVMNDDGTGLTRLTDPLVGAQSPSWSPDASRIAFAGSTPRYRSGLFTVRPDGTGLSLLYHVRPGVQDPDWMPASS